MGLLSLERALPESPGVETTREIDQFRHGDIDDFLKMAVREKWLCDRWELEFLLGSFPTGCFVVRQDGSPVAFITAIKYGTSGWIGNLLVRADLRRQGMGRLLMAQSLTALDRAGARTIWLTASPAGRPIYEQLGFRGIDKVKRWCGTGNDQAGLLGRRLSKADMVTIDYAGWGDDRSLLLSAVAARGVVHGSWDGFLITQRWPTGFQLGPWCCVDGEGAAGLLDGAMAEAGHGCRLFLDVPLRNLRAAALLSSRGFRVTGTTTLMCRGEVPDYDPGAVFALASMGSMG